MAPSECRTGGGTHQLCAVRLGWRALAEAFVALRPACSRVASAGVHVLSWLLTWAHSTSPPTDKVALPCLCLQADLLAGMSVACMEIPQGLAYASLAGLPSVFGLYGATIPCIIFCLFGSSRQLVSMGGGCSGGAVVGHAGKARPRLVCPWVHDWHAALPAAVAGHPGCSHRCSVGMLQCTWHHCLPLTPVPTCLHP